MSNTMSQDQQFQQQQPPNLQSSTNFNPSAHQPGNLNNNNSGESNPFEANFQSQGQPNTQNGHSTEMSKSNNYTRSSTQEPSESGLDKNDDGEDSEGRRQRFLERNRIAASKCRQKKKVWMQQLSSEADQAAARNKALQMMVNQLKDEVLVLKNQLLAHRNCNCNVIQQYIQTSGQFAAMNSQQPISGSLPNDHMHGSLLPPASGGALDRGMHPQHN